MIFAPFEQQYKWYFDKAIRYPPPKTKFISKSEPPQTKIVGRAEYLLTLCNHVTVNDESDPIDIEFPLLDAGHSVQRQKIDTFNIYGEFDQISEYSDSESLQSKKSIENVLERTICL